jgi:hypothetical protein
MIYKVIIAILFSFSVSAQTSNVQTVKAWTRNPVMGDPVTGELRDTSGMIGDAQRVAAIDAAMSESTNMLIAARTGLTNGLASLYAVTNRISEFEGRIYIAADMDESEGYSNVWMSVGKEWTDGNTNVNYWIYSNYELATCPATIWDFEVSATEVIYSQGEIQNEGNAVTNINGIAYYHVIVPRPSGVGNVVMRTNKHLKVGHSSKPLDLSAAGLTLNGSALYSGTISETNGLRVVTRTYSNGILVGRTATGGQ